MEHNIDLLDVRGSGKDARVLKEDVLGYIEMKKGMYSMWHSDKETKYL